MSRVHGAIRPQLVHDAELDKPASRRRMIRAFCRTHWVSPELSATRRPAPGHAPEPAARPGRHHARQDRYDELLMSGLDRDQARATVASEVERILDRWQDSPTEAARDDARGDGNG